jgi:glycylpeptide N-tetradecanoyltransferase
MENEPEAILSALKFGIGDGNLQYYLYNWRLNEELPSSEIGLVLT